MGVWLVFNFPRPSLAGGNGSAGWHRFSYQRAVNQAGVGNVLEEWMKKQKEFEAAVDTKKLAELLGMSEGFIDKARKHKGLPYYKVGGVCRYRLSEVEAWLQQRKAG